jgi:apolipoprotein N-acyltransferase
VHQGAIVAGRRLGRPLTALACGVALAAAFPPVGAWPLAVLAVAVLTLVVGGCRMRRAAWLGFLCGLTSFGTLLIWLRVVGIDLWLLLSVVLSLYTAGLACALAAVSRLRAWPLWSACLWVAEEAVRDRLPFGGFPWGRLAFSQSATPFTSYAALGGAPAVTFATVLVAALLAYAVLQIRRRRGRSAIGMLLAGTVMLLGSLVPLLLGGQPGGRQVSVAVVQGNVPRAGLDFLGQRRAVLDNHVRQSERLATEVAAGRLSRPDLVIWPENSSDIDPYANPDARAAIDAAVGGLGVPTLVGALVLGPDEAHVMNQGIVWDPVYGPGTAYTKRHPVPFGEYVPLRALITPYFSRLERIPRDFYRGDVPGVLQVGPARIGDVICFEIAYDHLVRDAVTSGGQILAVQTNNATFGRSGESAQQLAMSRLRAVEHGRAVLVAATSGISAVVAPDGTVMGRTRQFTPAVLMVKVPLRESITLADRVGAVPEWLLTMVGVLAFVVAVVSGRGARRGRTGDTADIGGAEPELILTMDMRGRAGA